MSKRTKSKQKSGAKTRTEPQVKRPTVLVLEGLSGGGAAILRGGGNVASVSPYNLGQVDKALAADWDALLLTGGGDVDPRLYGEKPHKQVYGVNETRDLAEWMALDEAARRGVPVLGICRGAQLMAVHNGGKLKQHIEGHRGVDHPAFTEEDSTFRATVGDSLMTVSLHHQVVSRTGNGWRVAARAHGGGIEAVESRDGRCLGVQFHPEMNFRTNDKSRAIFRWLVEEAAARAGIDAPPERKPKVEDQAWWNDSDYTTGWADDAPLPRSRPRAVENKPRPKVTPKRRPAGQQTLPGMGSAGNARRRGRNPVTTTWQCPICPLRFDEMDDRDDHVLFLHGDDRWATDIVPPPGHPDWEGS